MSSYSFNSATWWHFMTEFFFLNIARIFFLQNNTSIRSTQWGEHHRISNSGEACSIDGRGKISARQFILDVED
jgi:hypothetical protein